MERQTGIEPATFSLARRRSTTELLPHCFILPLRVRHSSPRATAETAAAFFDGKNISYPQNSDNPFQIGVFLLIFSPWASGGAGIRGGLKILWPQGLVGSNPTLPTKQLSDPPN